MEKKTLIRNPSFTPSPKLRKTLERCKDNIGVTGRLNQIWERYEYLIHNEAIQLLDEERQVFLTVLSASIVEPLFIQYLEQEIIDSEEYLTGNVAAKSLLKKIRAASYAQRLATIERLSF